jgi:hypothetical protein
MLSGLRYFRDEIDAHFLRGECPAGVCRTIRLGTDAPAAASSRTQPTETTPAGAQA